ncbi:probable ATP-dependent RNA helicase DDX46 isoform X2 [Strongylocentrotus purpuratus]|uniref:Probable ATP-dependent RNA helicase DDX46 n=1 Tax=Strongylocentrotus purpuratus TaxID=7668 RepID=A0A7M7NFG4_STRPU|nr:probable ATP-dependent RNA helicase DDX46 isoform X2 [Strongylocentrotus purpuratus]
MPRESRQYRKRSRSKSPDADNDSSKKKRSPERSKEKDKEKERRRSRSRSKSRERSRRSRSKERERDRSRKSRSRSRDRDRRRDRRSPPRRDRDIERDRVRERDRRSRRSRSRSRDRNRRRRTRSRSRSPKRSKGRRSQSVERASRSRSRSPNKDSKSKGSSSSSSAVKTEGTVKVEVKTEAEVKKEVEVKQEIKEEKEETKEVKEEKGLVLEQRRLEEEMQKRRERIERWRMERKKTMEAAAGPSKTEGEGEKADAPPQKPGKKWSLEDDDDADDEAEAEEEDEAKESKEPGPGGQEGKDGGEKMDDDKEDDEVKMEAEEDDDDDVDPLDAFMMGVHAEVKKIGSKDKKGPPAVEKAVKPTPGNGTGGEAPKFSIVTGVVKKKSVPVPMPVIVTSGKKGELMENDQDAMEYSSEEEKESNLMDTMAALEQKKKKELAKVDHSKIDYPPYRKDFYVEVPELARLTPEEVDKRRSDLEGVKVRGKGCPKPVDSWVQCGVSMRVLTILKKNNYEKPTPIQCQAIPAIMSGRDLIGIAKTGSGKTMAFLLPMFRHIMDQDPLEAEDGPITLIMTPTRELAMQIFKECKKFTKSMGLRAVCVYGGTGISEQIAELKRGAEIIVCTPGRMIDMLGANNGRVTNLRRCTYLVLDEADRMFDMGFEPQVMKIVENIRPDRQTVLFSATFPRQMEALARKILTKPIEVQVGGRSVVCSDVTQHAMILEEDQKFLKLLELLGYYDEGQILVFVEKQESADLLLKDLMKASYPCLALHGGIDQYDRDSIIQDFKAANVKILVATSVAARGLDVKNLVLVINYDCPNHYEDYVHRVGRTGRAGNKGFSYTFLMPEQAKYAGDVIKAFELSGAKVPEELTEMWSLYCNQQKSEGKEVTKNSGFSGKGFKFDDTERELANEKKKLQRAALGLQDSDDEDAGMDIDEKIETMFASKRRVKDVTADEIPVVQQPQANSATPGAAPGAAPAGAATTLPAGANQAMLSLAKRMAAKINKNLESERGVDMVQQATHAVMKGATLGQPAVSTFTRAEQMAAKLNAKLNYIPKINEEEKEEEQPKPTFRKYEEELEINDFPQTARWKVTSKENLAQIQDYSEAGITIRGTYFAPGKEPKEGERKLYLAIESVSDRAVSKAKAEITRLVKDELVRLQNSYQPTNKGRYKVL